MEKKLENNLLLALRGQAELTRELHETALATKALSWVTLDLVPRSLQLAFLNAAETIRAEEVIAFLERDLPEHVSYELVESFYGVDAVVRGQLPRGWVLKNLVRPADAATKIFEDAIEWEVTPIERLWWRDLPAGESGRPGTHFEPTAPEVQEEFPRFHLRQLRFIYNAMRLPTFPVYALIEPTLSEGQKALDYNQSRNLLSDLARSDLADPIRDLFLIEKRKPTAPGDVEADIVTRGLSQILKKPFCGVAVCEFTDVPRNGHDFRHHLEELHRWRHDVLKNTNLTIQNLYFLPFIGMRTSYEGGEAPDAAMRIRYSYERRLQKFAHPGITKNGGDALTLDLPIGDLVVCGTQLSGRSVLATWVCRQFLAAGYKVVYVGVRGSEAVAPADGPADQKSASLLGKIASLEGPVQYSKQFDVRDVLKSSQIPLAVYTEIPESSLLQEEPDLFLDWQQSSSPCNLFVMFDEIRKGGMAWVDRLQKQQVEGLHLGFVCRNVDEVPAIMDLAIKRATVIITNLSLSSDPGKPPNLELARALLKLVKRDKPQVPIDAEDLAELKSNRSFFLFPRPQKNQNRVYPVRGSLPDFDNLDPGPAERICWGQGWNAGSPTEAEKSQSLRSPWLYHVFISHASEDKDNVVIPLAERLRKENISAWGDWLIPWGEDITAEINAGIKSSRFMIVVLSSHYLAKEKKWAGTELNSGFFLGASGGVKKVLPLLVGAEEERKKILEHYALLQNRRHLVWDGTGEEVVQKLLSMLQE
jgi:hypothetical protein